MSPPLIPRRPRWALLAFLALGLALAFQGSRGIWRPDEGYYLTVASQMARTGDWLVPRLNVNIFLEKPPLTYWGALVGFKLLGVNGWGGRLFNGLCFFLTVLLVALLGRRLWGRRVGFTAGAVYLTLSLPFFASNIITPDTPLTLCVAAMWAFFYIGLRDKDRTWALALSGAAVGFGILAKGPAILIFGAPLVLYLFRRGQVIRTLKSPGLYLGASLALGIGGSWYGWLGTHVPGSWDYILKDQVTGRLLTAQYRRNPGWFGWTIYPAVLLAGGLPWSPAWLWGRQGLKGLPVRAWRRNPRLWFLALLILVPLTVLCLAQSRLPLYVLPLFIPLALLSGRQMVGWHRMGLFPKLFLNWKPILGGWVVFLLVLKLGAAWVPTAQDLRSLWGEINENPESTRTLVLTDQRDEGLGYYVKRELETVMFDTIPYPTFQPPDFQDLGLAKLFVGGNPRSYLISKDRLPYFLALLSRYGVVWTRDLSFNRCLVTCTPPNNSDRAPAGRTENPK